MESITNEHINEIMGLERKPDTIDIIEYKRLHWCGQVKRLPEERIAKLIVCWIPREKGKGWSKKTVDGRSTSRHDNRKFRAVSMEKQRGMAFGFRKTATAVKIPDGRTDR